MKNARALLRELKKLRTEVETLILLVEEELRKEKRRKGRPPKVEAEVVKELIGFEGIDVDDVATLLGISRTTVYRKLKERRKT